MRGNSQREDPLVSAPLRTYAWVIRTHEEAGVAITASQLRQDVYRLLDQVLDSGRPLEIERNGRLLRITPAGAGSRLERVATRPDLVTGDPADLAEVDWSDSWRP